MPTTEECQERRVEVVKLNGRVDAISERLDEVLEDIRDIKTLLKKYAMAAFVIAIFGQQALPLLEKLLAVQ